MTDCKMEEKPKKPMTDAERIELAKKLDRELDEFISGLEKKPYQDGWPEDRWEEEMAKHPFFMKKAPEPGEELHPLYEGLQQLKYDPDENSPEELAISYKEDGNFNFKHKNYRLAILSYTEGIKIKCGNPDLEVSLLNNRSASHYFLNNFRSSLRDCELALKLKPNHDKAVIRAANCCFAIERYDKCLEYCDKILEGDPENKVIQKLRKDSVRARTTKERDNRRRDVALRKKEKEENVLIEEILKRNINFQTGKDLLKLEYLEPHFPQLANSRVYLDENNNLVWPVVFLYPEYKTMDFIQQFSENDQFYKHLSTVFEEFPNWDEEQKYAVDNLNVYFENPLKVKVFAVNVNQSLKEILQSEMFLIRGGTPSFIIFAKHSEAEKSFLEKY